MSSAFFNHYIVHLSANCLFVLQANTAIDFQKGPSSCFWDRFLASLTLFKLTRSNYFIRTGFVHIFLHSDSKIFCLFSRHNVMIQIVCQNQGFKLAKLAQFLLKFLPDSEAWSQIWELNKWKQAYPRVRANNDCIFRFFPGLKN